MMVIDNILVFVYTPDHIDESEHKIHAMGVVDTIIKIVQRTISYCVEYIINVLVI